jgi:prevent-host-death family protein
MTIMTIMTIMTNEAVVGVAEAKARFSELLERVGRGERILVARRGRPAAILAPPGSISEPVGEPAGLASLAGALEDWDDLGPVMDDVIRSRRSARDRGAPDLR